jgi:hypothetical protein
MPFPHFKKIASVALIAALTLGSVAPSFAADTGVRVRGTVVSLSGDTLVVKSREGSDVTIKLTNGWAVGGITTASLADIKPGDFVGIASLPTASGGDGALEVLVFPPAMKGTGEGSYGWDLKPDSTMTNGSVSEAVKSVDGTTLNVVYHGQSKKISVAPGTPIVTFTQATVADIKAGTPVFIPAQKADDGSMSAARVVVGKNGVVPPM